MPKENNIMNKTQCIEQEGTMPSYGLLVINHTYHEGKRTFKERMDLSLGREVHMLELIEKSIVRAGGSTCTITAVLFMSDCSNHLLTFTAPPTPLHHHYPTPAKNRLQVVSPP